MLQLKSFNEFLIDEINLLKEHFTLEVRDKKTYTKVEVIFEEINPESFNLMQCLRENKKIDEKGIRFIILFDLSKLPGKFYIFIWPQHILHKDMLQSFDDNKSILNTQFENNSFRFYLAYNNVSMLIKKLDHFIFPGTFLKDSTKIISNFSMVNINQLNNEIYEQSKGENDLITICGFRTLARIRNLPKDELEYKSFPIDFRPY